MKLLSVLQVRWKYFSFPHALLSAIIYPAVIVAVNYGKEPSDLIAMAWRQALFSFVFTGVVVTWVEHYASVQKDAVKVFLCAVLLPALAIAMSSVFAHLFFFDDKRNFVAPFVVSLLLNYCLAQAKQAGNHTIDQQIVWAIDVLRRCIIFLIR